MASKTSTKSKQNHIGFYFLKEVLNRLGKKMYGEDFLFENHLGQIGDSHGNYVNTLAAADCLIREMFFEVIKDDGSFYRQGESLFVIERDGKTVSDFKIPKEQFDYFLCTKKQFRTQNFESLGSIMKKFNFEWGVVYNLMHVGTKDNLISYFELAKFYKKKFNAKDWEIDLWIYLSFPEDLKTLKGEVDDEGCVRFDEGYVEVFGRSSNSANYTRNFFFKPQAEKLNPERYSDFQTLAGLWQKKFSIDEDKIIDLISGHLTFLRARDLLSKKDFYDMDVSISSPIHKKNRTSMSDEASYEEKARFIKEAAFGATYIKAIEDKYFFRLMPEEALNQKSKRLIEFKSRLKDDIKQSPNAKLLPKISYNHRGNSYQKIGEVDYQLSARDVNNCWKEVVGELPENHPWRKSRRPKKNIKES